MVLYASPEYFETLAQKLNEDADFRQRAASLKAELLFVENGRPDAALLKIENGKATSQIVAPDTKAEFIFMADRPVWISNHKDGIPLEKLIMTGKIKFKGSIPRIMTIKSQLNAVDQKAKSIPATY